MFLEIQEAFHSFDKEVQRAEMGQYTPCTKWRCWTISMTTFDAFRLLLDCAEGTQFSRFVEELVEIEVDYTYKYMEVIGCESVKSGLVTEEFVHIVVTAYFNGMFEVVRHNMDKNIGGQVCTPAKPLSHARVLHYFQCHRVLIR
mgnify:CR=1 FL=1